MHVLGIDLGTSALKAVLVDADQTIVAGATVPLKTRHPRPGWSEQRPGDWQSALDLAMAELRSADPDALRDVRALGLSGQMHGAVLVDSAGRAIRPAILWNDGRAVAECAALMEAVPDLARIAGIIAMPGFTAPKLLWLARHEPEAVSATWKVLPPKDFLRLALTGDALTEMSDAAGTLWLDQGRRDWSDAVLAASGLDRDRMPGLVEGSDRAGELRAETCAAWGIAGPVVVAGGAGDAVAAAIGIGAVEDGDAFVSLGTSAQYFVADDQYRPQPATLLHAFAHALPRRWFRMAAMLNGASVLEWVARLVGAADIGALVDQVAAKNCRPSDVLFLPYLSGERTPHNDPNARGVFFGLHPSTGPLDLVQATLEGVVFTLREAQEALDAAGARPERLAAVGGGARSRYWLQILADCLGRPVIRYTTGDNGPAFGASRLARLALTGETVAEVCGTPAILDVLEPQSALYGAYAERLDSFRSLYRALKPEFQRWQAIVTR
jgi:xylulokinase